MRDRRVSFLAYAALAGAASAAGLACSASSAPSEQAASTDEAIVTCAWPKYVDCEYDWDVPGPHKRICQCLYDDPPAAKELALGQATAYMLGDDGYVYSWGSGASYARGDGSTYDATMIQAPLATYPTSRFPRPYQAVHVTAGDTGGSAVLTDGTIIQWGTVATLPSPVVNQTPALVAGITVSTAFDHQLAQGSHHACAISATDQSVWCWGDNASGQLGDGTTTSRATPAPVTDPQIVSIEAIAAAHDTTCAVRYDGHVFCWGDNTNGSLGYGSKGEFMTTPIEAHGWDPDPNDPNYHPPPRPNAIFGGGSGTFCAATQHSLTVQPLCWGANAHGQAGTEHTADVNAPFPSPLALGKYVFTFGTSHGCVGGSDGNQVVPALCFGSNAAGQLGDPSIVGDRFAAGVAPVPPPPETNEFRTIAAGGDFTCAVTKDAPAYVPPVMCWGANDHGQLGRGKTPGTPGQPAPLAWYD